MRRLKAALLYGMFISALPTPLLHCARADEMPVSGTDDSRMRYIAYGAGQVVHLSTTVGSTLVVGFSPTETVTAVAETDTIHLAAIPKGNYLFFKPSAALPLQPIIVLTQRPDGSLRRYVFEMETVADPTTANGADGVFYSVQFTYPADVAAAAEADRAMARPEHGFTMIHGTTRQTYSIPTATASNLCSRAGSTHGNSKSATIYNGRFAPISVTCWLWY